MKSANWEAIHNTVNHLIKTPLNIGWMLIGCDDADQPITLRKEKCGQPITLRKEKCGVVSVLR